MGAGSIILLALIFLSFLFVLGLFCFFVRKTVTLLKMLVVNTIVGLTLVVLLGWVGVQVPLTKATLIIIGLFGMAGLGSLLTLMFFGML